METLEKIASHTWTMVAEMGAFLLLGFLISVLLHKLIKQTWVTGLLGKRKLSSVVWGSVVGVPMPLCSCGVIPVTMSLHAKGASRGATVSFLTSTPQTGADSFLATYGMLGPVFALYKIVVAFVSGIAIGLVTDFLAPSPNRASPTQPSSETPPQPSWKDSLRYGLVTMPGDLAGALLLGFVLAGLVSALAPADLLSNIPGGAISAILLATVISVPFYICSTGSIPLALALVHSGLPISAALVLLIAGPATNIATITAMRKVLGGRSTLIYVLGIIFTTWIAAAVYHLFLDNGTLGTHDMAHEHALPLWKHIGGAVLLALLLFPFLSKRFGSNNNPPAMDDSNAKIAATLLIEGMNCSHCENSVREGLASLPFTKSVLSVDRNERTAVIEADAIDEIELGNKLSSLGFEFKGIKR